MTTDNAAAVNPTTHRPCPACGQGRLYIDLQIELENRPGRYSSAIIVHPARPYNCSKCDGWFVPFFPPGAPYPTALLAVEAPKGDVVVVRDLPANLKAVN